MAKSIVENTPLIKQYFNTKSKHPDAVLLFRVGDFYEAYGKDALLIVDILHIALTYKSNGSAGKIEMAGFPHHAVDNFLPKLVRAGKRVAICDQLENPKTTKKLVKRGITELVTPGVSTNDNILNNKENNFLAGLYINKDKGGISFLDISTGEFYTAEGSLTYLDKLISNFDPKELIYERSKKNIINEKFHFNGAKFEMEDWVYTSESANTRLLKHFKTKNLKGFGINNMLDAIIASGSVLYYMDMTEHYHIDHIKSISRIEEERYVRLDRYTISSLELCNSINIGGKSLLSVIDKTKSSMGGRLLHRWVLFPLKNSGEIKKRQEVVSYFYKNIDFKDSIRGRISQIGDLERIVSKISVGRVSPRELIYLKNSLFAIEEIKNIYSKENIESNVINILLKGLDSCDDIKIKIENQIIENPPVSLSRGTVIKNGVNSELDELRKLSTSGKDYLKQLLEREIESTGISKLKIGFNNVFGYYLEVRNANKELVPEQWIRKQTLVSAERYITQELKEYESKILGAEEKISELEIDIYNKLVSELLLKIEIFLKDASIIAKLDCLISFAQMALDNNYNCPDIFDDDILSIKKGRHPVIETQMAEDEYYVPNDITLDSNNEQIMIITGPNMAGKSALLRQTALITLLAQIGSYVPAESAHIGVVDKIFTRVGSSDNISQGESTFMIEMNEASDIINNMSQKSLILFDELGRGTSTYDGISIAWSIVEYIHENKKAHAKTLFATHYHELNEMTHMYDRIKNYHISVKESNDKVIFLRKLVKGGTEHSFGIHVAKMAGMPPSIVDRANIILKKLEEENRKEVHKSKDSSLQEGMQLSFYQLDDPVLSDLREELLKVDINNLTPIEALNKLSYIKKIIKK